MSVSARDDQSDQSFNFCKSINSINLDLNLKNSFPDQKLIFRSKDHFKIKNLFSDLLYTAYIIHTDIYCNQMKSNKKYGHNQGIKGSRTD